MERRVTFMDAYQEIVAHLRSTISPKQVPQAAARIKNELLQVPPSSIAKALGLQDPRREWGNKKIPFMQAYQIVVSELLQRRLQPAEFKKQALAAKNSLLLFTQRDVDDILKRFQAPAAPQAAFQIQTYTELRQAFGQGQQVIDAAELKKALTGCKDATLAQLNTPGNWVGSTGGAFKAGTLRPFAQKVVAPAGSRVVIFGDFHGDALSLFNALDTLRAQNILHDNFRLAPNINMVFLGDLVDRGNYNVETLYVAWRLKAANPDRVFLLRGNHETQRISGGFGLLGELQKRFPTHAQTIFNDINQLFDLQAAALFLGTGNDYALLFHGGLEPGFTPQRVQALLSTPGDFRLTLLGDLDRDGNVLLDRSQLGLKQDYYRNTLRLPLTKNNVENASGQGLGFLWNEFEPKASGRGGIQFNQPETETVLGAYSQAGSIIHPIIKNHSH